MAADPARGMGRTRTRSRLDDGRRRRLLHIVINLPGPLGTDLYLRSRRRSERRGEPVSFAEESPLTVIARRRPSWKTTVTAVKLRELKHKPAAARRRVSSVTC